MGARRLAPEEIVALVDFTYIDDMLTPADALAHLQSMAGGKQARVEALLRDGLPAYATSPGWLGYDDDKLAREVVEVVADGFSLVKLKVGRNVDDDVRRLKVARRRRASIWPCSTSWPSPARATVAGSEYVDHLHEHFETPVVVRQGRYLAPTEPGAGARFHPDTIERFTFPTGAEWR